VIGDSGFPRLRRTIPVRVNATDKHRSGHPQQPRRTTRIPAGPPQQVRQAPPAFVPPPLGVMVRQHEELLAQNQRRLAELRMQGIDLDPFTLVHLRIDKLIDSIAQFAGADGPRWAALTRLSFERAIAEEIDKAAPAMRQANLAIGANFTPGMIAELARQSGMFQPHK
jgi:hypothetical protein